MDQDDYDPVTREAIERLQVVRADGYSELHLAHADVPEVTLCGRLVSEQTDTAHRTETKCSRCRREAEKVRATVAAERDG